MEAGIFRFYRKKILVNNIFSACTFRPGCNQQQNYQNRYKCDKHSKLSSPLDFNVQFHCLVSKRKYEEK